MRDLQPSDHGRRFSATIMYTPTEGKLCIEKGRRYLCQNSVPGVSCLDKLGYTYSYLTIKSLENLQKSMNFKFINMTAKEIEEYKDFKKGDVLKNNGGRTKKTVAEQLGIVSFTQNGGDDSIYVYSTNGLYGDGWRLDVTPEEETPKVVELSVAEVAKKLGVDPSLLKIVDK
jgi:hypothetical protein